MSRLISPLVACAPGLDRRFEAIVFDWDGTAVPDRTSDASAVRELIEQLCAAGVHLVIVSGTHVGNVDGQLGARPSGPGRLLLALNRGSEIFAVDADGPRLLDRRLATPAEDAALDVAARRTVAALGARGLSATIVSSRLNRRKIDLIPLPEWNDPPKAEFDRLLEAVRRRLTDAGIADLREAVEIAMVAARDVGLTDPRITSDAKHIEIGLTDKSDSARWILRDWAARGIFPPAILIGGDELGPVGGLPGSDSLLLVPEIADAVTVSVGVEPHGVPTGVVHRPAGPDAFLAILRDQLSRRRAGDLPWIAETPGWAIAVDGFDPGCERARGVVLSLADGSMGTSGAPLLGHPAASPTVLVANVFHGDGPDTQLLSGPVWHRLPGALAENASLRRVLGLRDGLLHEAVETPLGGLRSVRFCSLARPGTSVLRVHRPVSGPLPSPLVGAGADPDESSSTADVVEMCAPASDGGIVAVAGQDRRSRGEGDCVDRVAVFEGSAEAMPDPTDAKALLQAARRLGFDGLLAEHRASWAKRWDEADIVIEGAEQLQLAVRFALFHLMSAAADRGESAVGARGLTGTGYRGHVFWDADIFVLPFLAATHPLAARSMLEYRARRLGAALDAARAERCAGARFPWESARSGRDVTPTSTRDRTGRVVPIRTGRSEVHIVADVAWAAACYLDWTGDEDFAKGVGARILLETARYWASRIHVEADGSAHLYGVIGPDEYHEPVDDNAFTNIMARWNLRRAAAWAGSMIDDVERDRWHSLAAALVDGYDRETRVYEQFAGFRGLEPLIIEEVAPRRPIAADLLLGRERVRAAQVIKQPDILMGHHLIPEEMAPDSLQPNLDFYEPRTAHGSSLSPGIFASLFARAGDDRHALEALDLATRIDLDDLTDTTGGGLHMANLGSIWQALVFGYGGIRPTSGGQLAMDPRLPPAWSCLEIRIRFRGSLVRVRIEPETTDLVAEHPIDVSIGDTTISVGPDGRRLTRVDGHWEAE